MKICYLADAQSIHTQRWIKSIKDNGHEVILISFRDAKIDTIPIYVLKTPQLLRISPTVPLWSKFHYLFGKRQARNIIQSFKPDILHAFWATSYGLLGARLHHQNFLLSVWGSDIGEFFSKAWFLRTIIRFSLTKAKLIFCTSSFLTVETKKIIKDHKKIRIIPFGVNLSQFPIRSNFNKNEIIIGSTKSFESIYRIDLLIKAFAVLYRNYTNLRLRLIGTGSQKVKYQKLIEKLNIGDVCELITNVSHNQIPIELEKMDIFVIPSFRESFGVSALEASAMGLPVIGTKVGGLPEVIKDGETGILIPINSKKHLEKALIKLIESAQLRELYGKNGREFIKRKYQWKSSVAMKIREYEKLLY